MAESPKLWNTIEKGAFKENPLHEYERTSYDVSLHLANTFDTRQWQKAERELRGGGGKEINSINSDMFSGGVVTLLESASTITTMTDLMIEGYASPNNITDTGFSTKFRMSVVQPLGVSLVENIYKAAAVLGIKNHYSHPFFLQVVLKGRKADGEIDVEIPNTRRLYCVYIKNITYQVDVGSSNYQIEGIRAGDLNNADDHSLVQKTTLKKIDNFDDFLNSFQEEVNKQERHKLGSTKAILDQYVFRVDSNDDEIPVQDIADSPIAADPDTKTNPQNLSTDEDSVKSEIARNTSIKEVLERFMSRNKFMQEKISATRKKLTATEFGEKEIEDLDVKKHLFTISTHNELLSYDSLRRDYARKFVYTITVAAFTSITAAVRKEFDKISSYTKKRVDDMIDRKVLVKRYDYFNTGMNLDVLNFNINYNYQYVYGLDTMVGLFNKYSEAFNTIINQQVNSSADIQRSVKDGVEGNQKFNEFAKDGELTTGEKYWIKVMQQRNLKNIKELYDTGAVEPDSNTLEAYNALVKDFNEDYKNYEHLGEQLQDNARYNPHRDPLVSPKLNALDSYTYHPVYGWSLPSSNMDRSSGKLGGQNILGESIPNEMYADALKEDQGGTQFPVQFYERFVDPSQEGMIEVSTADASGFTTILRNAKVGSAEMVKVTMDIIGDPYWLDHPAYYHKGDDDNKGHPEMADYKKENCILFCSLIPTEKDADSGYAKTLSQRNNEFLTAIYRVWKIEHKFSNGMFTQTLHMIRDAITDLSLLTAGDIKIREPKESRTSIDDKLFTNLENISKQDKVNKNIVEKKIDTPLEVPNQVGKWSNYGNSVKDVAQAKSENANLDVQETLVNENKLSGELKKQFVENAMLDQNKVFDAVDNNDVVAIDASRADVLGYNHGVNGSGWLQSDSAIAAGFDVNNDKIIDMAEEKAYNKFLKMSPAEQLNYKRERESNKN